MVDLLRSRRFWALAQVLSRMLRPVFIEIGLVEQRSSGLADLCASFGRLCAHFLQLKKDAAVVAPGGAVPMAPLLAVAADQSVSVRTHELCACVLFHLQWRLAK